MSLLFTLNYLLALGGLALLALTIDLYIDYFCYQSTYYRRFIQNSVWFIIPTVTVGSVVISIFYSEYLGFIPCSLCWLQRIALYPQALFSLMAFRTKESVYFPLYSIGLSLFGFTVAVYQYILQLLPKEVSATGIMPCLTDGSADCTSKIIDEFGFVTLPLLSAITFVFLIIIYLNVRRNKNQTA